jgi:hypothetical protein
MFENPDGRSSQPNTKLRGYSISSPDTGKVSQFSGIHHEQQALSNKRVQGTAQKPRRP